MGLWLYEERYCVMQILSKLFYRIEDEPFVRPNLEENGTMGGSVAACEANSS